MVEQYSPDDSPNVARLARVPGSGYTRLARLINQDRRHEKEPEISGEAGDGMSLLKLGWNDDIYYTPAWGWPWKVSPSYYQEIMKRFESLVQNENLPLHSVAAIQRQRELMHCAVHEVFDRFIKRIVRDFYPQARRLDPVEVIEKVNENLERFYQHRCDPYYNQGFIRKRAEWDICDLLEKYRVKIQTSLETEDEDGNVHQVDSADPTADTEFEAMQFTESEELRNALFIRNEAELTKMQAEVIHRFAKGMSEAAIAFELYSEVTERSLNRVRSHKSSAKDKIEDYLLRR